jgi:ABC-2 type transport system permease protein
VADVTARAGIIEQVALVAGLRWQMFRNSLRSTSARLDLLGVVLASGLTGLFTASVGFGLAVTSYHFLSHDRPGWLAAPLWAVFSLWQFMPLMLATSTAAFDFRNLLRFPLRFPAFFLLSLAYGLFDPAAVASLFWLLSIGTGIALARPLLLPTTLIVLAAFAVTNLLLSRVTFSWLERLLARRRTREALVAIFLLLLLGAQLSAALGQRWERVLRPYLVAAQPVLEVLPPGLAGAALVGAAQGNVAKVTSSMALLLGYVLAAGALLRRRLRAQYQGEDLSEGQAPRVVDAATSVRSVSFAPSFLPGPVAAVFEKECRYLLRNSVLLLNSFLPVLLVAFFGAAWRGPRNPMGFLSHSAGLAFPAAIAYMFLIVGQFALNIFAYEGRGIQVFFVAPVRFRDVLLGKNLMFSVLLAVETMLVWMVVSLLFPAPGALIVLATLLGLLFAALVHFVVGNWLSLKFPRRFEFGQYRRRPSGITMLAGLGLQILVIGLVASVVLLARWSGRIWLIPVVFFTLAAIMLLVYRASLNLFTRLADRQREDLAGQLCR